MEERERDMTTLTFSRHYNRRSTTKISSPPFISLLINPTRHILPKLRYSTFSFLLPHLLSLLHRSSLLRESWEVWIMIPRPLTFVSLSFMNKINCGSVFIFILMLTNKFLLFLFNLFGVSERRKRVGGGVCGFEVICLVAFEIQNHLLIFIIKKQKNYMESPPKSPPRNSRTSLMDNLLGLLRVRVKKGINLAVRDVRSSDPYCVIKMGKQVLL